MAGLNDVTKGAEQLARMDGIAGMTAGVFAAPMARGALYSAAGDSLASETARNVTLIGQGILGGMAASGRLAGRGGVPRAIGAGVAVEALYSLGNRYLLGE